MRFTPFVALVLFITFAAISECQVNHKKGLVAGVIKPRSLRSVHGKRGSNDIYQDMLLRNIYVHSFLDSSSVLNRAATFNWSDPNSNTSTYCSTSWLDSRNSTNYPTSYTLCDNTSSQEAWQWYFSSYVSGNNFTLQLAHQFKDPVQFPPPFETVTFFSTTDVKLKCNHLHGLEGCHLPHDGKVVHAVVNGIAN